MHPHRQRPKALDGSLPAVTERLASLVVGGGSVIQEPHGIDLYGHDRNEPQRFQARIASADGARPGTITSIAVLQKEAQMSHLPSLEELDQDGAIREAAENVDGDTRAAFLRKAGVGGGRGPRQQRLLRCSALDCECRCRQERRRDPQLRVDARVPRGGVLHRGRQQGQLQRRTSASSRASFVHTRRLMSRS